MVTQAKNTDEYIAELQGALVKNPDCANTNYNLGVALLSKRMFREAEESFLKAVDASPKLAEAYVQLGGIALQRGDLDSCLNYNRMAAAQQPFFPVPYANIGFVHMQRGEAKEAIAAFNKAVKRDPKYIQAYANLGGIHFMQGDFEESLKNSQKALELEPMFGPAYHNMAMVYIEQGKFEDAIAAIDKAIETGYDVPEKVLEELKPHRK